MKRGTFIVILYKLFCSCIFEKKESVTLAFKKISSMPYVNRSHIKALAGQSTLINGQKSNFPITLLDFKDADNCICMSMYVTVCENISECLSHLSCVVTFGVGLC